MKKNNWIMFGLILLVSCNSIKETKGNYDLNWKINDNEIVKYKTIMQVIEQKNDDLESIFKNIDAFDNEDYEFFKKEMDSINDDFKNSKIRSIMFKDDFDIIQIKMFAEFKDQSSNDSLFRKSVEQNDGVMLRGSVNSDGSIHSFWLKSGQKNLISMFFELPKEPINIGDTWELDVNYIGNDQNFICKRSNKTNEVKLIDVISKDGKDIALLKYNIKEFVFGEFNMPMNTDKENDLTMEFSFEAIAEFSITDGRWIKFEGVINQEISGYMNNSGIQKISLIPE